uniref:Thioredoxin domain-containing protein n=1 Tax=Oncorhynchus tshawytscha TaxID=74940 RepID=A0AAZ3RY80_ONCTS
MGLITEVIAFFYHLPQIYKWLFKPYYILSTLMSTAFLILRKCPGLCENLNTEREDRNPCDFDLREVDIIMFIGAIVMMKNRRDITIEQHAGNLFMFSKVANIILFFRLDIRLGFLYFLLCIGSCCTPCSDKTMHASEFNHDTRVTWIVEFYANWAECQSFADLCLTYLLPPSLSPLVCMDAGRYGEVAQRYKVSTSSLAKQLPSLVLFQSGREVMRHPMVDNKFRAVSWTFSEENMIRVFNLNKLFKASKKIKKGRGVKGEDQNPSLPDEGSEERQPEPDTPAESKKDQ